MANLRTLLSGLIVIVAVAALVSGCNSTTPPSAAPPAAPSGGQEAAHEGHNHAEHADHAATDSHGAQDDPLAELSPEDRAAAEKQGVCLVSGEKLGSMGTPYKTTVKGQTVFLCCDGCEEKLQKEPDKYLAKLNK
jgi:Cu(I)/Ag(I) efflux system membrane fusion protein